MHILLFHDSVMPPKNYGGIERIVVTLAEEYSRRGHRVSVLCRKGSKLPGFSVVEIPEGGPGSDIMLLVPKDVDFIHSHQPIPVEPSVPYLITIHGNGHPGEMYHPNTNFLSRSHARNHGSSIFIFNGVDPKRYPFVENKEDYFIFLARTTWRVKNLKTTLAWARDLGVRLKIIGGNGVSLHKNIEYLGLVDESTKVEVLSKARALVYPTNWDEPCAGAPLEAFACGTPVISTRNGCMPEMVRTPEMGVLCDTYQDLLGSVEKLKSAKPRVCRQMAETVFSNERMALDYLKLFERILKEGKLANNHPHYSFDPGSVKLLYKPTIVNRLQVGLTGKI